MQSWDWLKLDPGKSWSGWSAGPMVEVHVHHRGGSRPCRRIFTHGKLACTGCSDKLDVVWRGYVPLWDDAGGRWLAIIGERYYDLACDISFLARVKVTKMLARGCPIRAEAVAVAGNPQPACIARRGPASIHPFLLRIWKDAELSAWVRANPVEVDLSAPSPSVEVSRAEHEALSKVVTGRLRERFKVVEPSGTMPGLAADSVSQVLGHFPGANGKKGKH